MSAPVRTTVHLLRHGEVHNPQGVLYGQLEGYHLSELGHQMAQAVARHLADHDVTHVVASSLERAQETARPVAESHGLPVTTDDRVIEASNRFEARAEGVLKQYDGSEAVPGVHLNGKQTLGENIADIGGLKVAFLAYQMATKGKALPTVDGLTPDQRFFVAFAQGWRTNQRPEQLRLQAYSDVHSPVRFRVLGPVDDLPSFYQAFGCPVPAGIPQVW